MRRARPSTSSIRDLALGDRLLGHQAQVALGDAVAQDRDAAPRAEGPEFFVDRQVGIEYRRAIRGEQFVEQAQLGGQVGRHVAMVVEVVARQRRERRGLDPDTVEPVLVEAVARRLHDQVVDAVFG